MNIKKIFACGMVGAITTITPALNAAEAEIKADIDLPKSETRTEIKRDRDLSVRAEADRTDTDKVRSSNKASGLLGMEVRNSDNQKLGEIKDLVMDVNSGKVSYAVLAVGGFLGVGEKLVALPPSALHVSEDHSHLRVNADKARIQAAPGFAATAWPSVNDPEINAFWKEASGSAAGSEVRRSSGKTGVDADVNIDRDRKRIETELEVDKKNKIYTDADKDKKVKVEIDKD